MTDIVSPGARQKHRGRILRNIASLRGVLDLIESWSVGFEADCNPVMDELVELLAGDSTSLIYLIGQANGAILLPDNDEGARHE